MASECEKLLRNLKKLDGNLVIEICRLGCGGDGNVWLYELEKDSGGQKVAVKSVSTRDTLWKK